MSDEAAFLAHIRANPADALSRLVYADWLEEQGDDESARKAAFLRAEVRFHDPELRVTQATELLAGQKLTEKRELIRKMRALAEELPADWKMAIARTPVENCSTAWAFICPQRWHEFLPTADEKVRHCETCQQDVHYCTSIEAARDRASQGQCVTLDLGVRRAVNDLGTEYMLSGLFDFRSPQTPKEQLRHDERSERGGVLLVSILETEPLEDPVPRSDHKPWWKFW